MKDCWRFNPDFMTDLFLSYKHIVYFVKTGLFLLTLLIFANFPLFAYTDEIDLKLEEVWPAAKEAFQFAGLHRVNEKKFSFETNWIEDTVERTRKLLPLKGLGEIKKTVKRRYQFKVKLKDIASVTQVKIQTKFQEQPADIRPQSLWRTVKPEYQDMQVEKRYFLKIIEQLEARRKPQV